MAMQVGKVQRGYEVSAVSPQRPGQIAAAGRGWCVMVWPSAKERPDWAAMSRAIGTAFVRGAEVHMYGGGDE